MTPVIRSLLETDPERFVFSHGLNLAGAFGIHRHFAARKQFGFGFGFGFGTNLANDIGRPPPKIVMKLVCCNAQSVARHSDPPGKTACTDETFLA